MKSENDMSRQNAVDAFNQHLLAEGPLTPSEVPFHRLDNNNGKIPPGGNRFLSSCVIISYQDAHESSHGHISRQMFPHNTSSLNQPVVVW